MPDPNHTYSHVPEPVSDATHPDADPAATVNGSDTVPIADTLPEMVGRYELGEEIARGGMGAVYRATDTALGREVAVKVLLDKFEPQSGPARRFADEARITGQLQHPAIPPVHDVGTFPDGRPFLAMKLIKGQTLADLLASGERESPEMRRGSLIAVFEQVCQGLAYAHAHNVIHRDLKPANVMVGSFGEVQVMDWGLAKVLGSRDAEATDPEADLEPGAIADPDKTTDHHPHEDSTEDRTRVGQVMGTPAYMPPEQARGEWDRVDAHADVFALGGILCVILTGKPLYTGKTAVEVVRRAATADLTDAFARLDACGADAEVIALCKRCLATNPAERPANGKAVAEAVAAYRVGVEERAKKAEAERAAAAAEAREQRKRRKVQLALAGAVALLLAAGGAFAWWSGKKEAERVAAEGDRKAEQAVFDRERQIKAEQAREQATRLLAMATELRKQYRFGQAADALTQARDAASGGAPDLLPAVEQARADFDFVRQLDAIRMKRSTWIMEVGGKGHFDEAGAPPAYRAAFASRGLDVVADPVAVGARVAASAVRDELVGALDDWALLEKDTAVRDRVLAALRRADPDSGAAPFRDPAVWMDRAKLEALATKLDVARLSPGAAVAIAGLLSARRANAAPLLRHAMSLHPRDFLIAFALGQVLGSKNIKDLEAMGAYRVARALRPDNLAVLINLGNALRDSGDIPGAIAAYRKAIRLDPKDAPAHVNLGVALGDSGDLRGAITAYREAIRLDPKLAQAHVNLGVALQDSGDIPGAIAAYREAIRLDPKYAKAHYNLGNALRESGDYRGAIVAYREAIRLNPKFAQAHVNLGVALQESGDIPGAIAAYREAIRLDPKLAMAHINLGAVYFGQKKYPEAIACARAAIKADPRFSMAHAMLGDLLLLTGDIAGARVALTEAARLNPRWKPLLAKLPPIPTAPPPREVKRP